MIEVSPKQEITNEELVLLYQSTDNKKSRDMIKSKVYKQNYKLIVKFAKIHSDICKKTFSSNMFDDFMQEGALILFRCLDIYDKDRGTLFSSYLSVLMKNKFKDVIRREYNAVKKNIYIDGYDEARIEDILKDRAIEEGIVIIPEYEKYLDFLSEREVEILKRYFGFAGIQGMTMVEVAKFMGISPQRTLQLKNSGLKKLRQIIEKEEPYYEF